MSERSGSELTAWEIVNLFALGFETKSLEIGIDMQAGEEVARRGQAACPAELRSLQNLGGHQARSSPFVLRGGASDWPALRKWKGEGANPHIRVKNVAVLCWDCASDRPALGVLKGRGCCSEFYVLGLVHSP